jgi:hypothetical protein
VETGASDEPTLLIQSENSSIYLRTAGSSGSFPTGGGGNDGELLYIGGDFRVGVGSASKNLIFMNGSSYTERMRIDSSGRVGIGTSSPANMLHLSNTSEGTHDLAFNRNTTYGASTGLGGVSWYNQAGDTKLTRIESQTDGAATNTRLIFSTASSGTLTERMRITSAGNVGLGVTPSAWSANYKAIQSGNGSAFAGFNGNDQTFVVSNAYNDGAWKYKNSAGAGRYTIQGVSNGLHAWFTAPSGTAGNAITFTQAMTLDASGNLGIGTTAPDAPLHVKGDLNYVSALNANGTITISSDDTGNNGFDGAPSIVFEAPYNTGTIRIPYAIIEGRKETTAAGITSGFLAFSTAAVSSGGTTERMRIDSSGNLLVGTTTTSVWDASAGSAADNGISLLDSGTLGVSSYQATPVSGFVAAINRTGTDGNLVIFQKDGTHSGVDCVLWGLWNYRWDDRCWSAI